MPLLSRLSSLGNETIDDMSDAALSRLREGETLFQAGYWDAAIYLLGYVAEMVLKIAFCRIDNTTTGVTVARSILPGAAMPLWGTLAGTPKAPKSIMHSLLFLETVVGLRRRQYNLPALPYADALLLSKSVQVIGDEWQVDMRYQPQGATEAEAQDVLIAVQWMYTNRNSFWR